MSEQAKHGEGDKPIEGHTASDGDKSSSKSLVMMGAALVILCFVVGLSISALTATKAEVKKEEPVVEEAGPEVMANRSVLPTTNEIYGGESEEGEELLGAFFPFEPFVVNLRGGGFLRVQVQVELTQRDIPASIIARNVILRDGIISLLSARAREDVLGLKARDELKSSIANLINSTLNRDLVKKVYFTQFVAQ